MRENINSQFVKQFDEWHVKRLRWRIKEIFWFLIKIRKFILLVFQNDLFKSPILQRQKQVTHSRHWKFETVTRWVHEKVVNFKLHVSRPKVSRSLWPFTLRRSLNLATFYWRETRKKSNLRLWNLIEIVRKRRKQTWEIPIADVTRRSPSSFLLSYHSCFASGKSSMLIPFSKA